jgi:hypothetical protein
MYYIGIKMYPSMERSRRSCIEKVYCESGKFSIAGFHPVKLYDSWFNVNMDMSQLVLKNPKSNLQIYSI